MTSTFLPDSDSKVRVLAGLGNPGPEYAVTRHNLGFICVDAVAEALKLTWRNWRGGEVATTHLDRAHIFLFKPTTYMNRSGEPLRTLLEYHHVPTANLAVVADDVYLPPGTVRIRRGGSHGGHNGWKSVSTQLGAGEYWRIRLGAGVYEQHPDKRTHQPPMEDYVLQKLSAGELVVTEKLIDRLVPKLVRWLEHGELTEETAHVS